MKNLVGRKVKGFKLESEILYCSHYMNKYIGEVGVITDVDVFDLEAEVEFEDGETWYYPLGQIEEHLVPEWEIGKEYEFSDDGEFWTQPMRLAGVIDHECKYIVESRGHVIGGYKKIREIKPKVKELTLEEAEQNLTQFLGIQIKIKK